MEPKEIFDKLNNKVVIRFLHPGTFYVQSVDECHEVYCETGEYLESEGRDSWEGSEPHFVTKFDELATAQAAIKALNLLKELPNHQNIKEQ